MKGPTREIEAELADGCTLRGRFYGSNPNSSAQNLCLCIHGLAVDCNVWEFFAQRWMDNGGNVVCFDLRGHGLSERGSWYSFRPKVMARDLVQACTQLGLQPAYIAAQSFGNFVALEVLQRSSEAWAVRRMFAITPVWSDRRPGVLQIARLLRQAGKFLRAVGNDVGFRTPRVQVRRDHTPFAAHPDSYHLRFCEEARSVGWLPYAWLMLYIEWRRWRVPAWGELRNLPVLIIGATGEGIWDNEQITRVSARTGWPLHWLDMRHVSLSTDAQYASKLMALIEDKGLLV